MTSSTNDRVRLPDSSPDHVDVDCWCGDTRFVAFGPDYLECVNCGTLVSQKGLSTAELQVVDDEHDYYGKNYWLDHQQQDFDYPGLEARVRSDLPERNLHWLRALLKYQLPAAKVMELGCAHGSFVALMQQAGYTASGVEMSPWIVAFGRKTFGIEVHKGPVEQLVIAPGSLDVIAMMDVMEHLPNPVGTMSHCLDLLKPDGLLLVQMPNFQEGMQYDELVSSNSTFLDQLKSDEHLYLYSKRAATEFFHRLGADHIQFEPAIFAHYDMFFAVSRRPLQVNTPAQVEGALEGSPSGRLVLAMLDMKDRYDQAPSLRAEVAGSSEKLQELFARADEFSNARNLAQAQLADLQRNFEAVEKDRAARGEVIEAQGRSISELQGQVDLRLKELHALFPQMEEWKNLAQSREVELSNLIANFGAMEEDRLARGEVIEAQGHLMSELQGQMDALLKELQELREALAERVLDVQQLRDSLSEQENAHQRDIAQRDAEMQALTRRWWWKLGKLIKVL